MGPPSTKESPLPVGDSTFIVTEVTFPGTLLNVKVSIFNAFPKLPGLLIVKV